MGFNITRAGLSISALEIETTSTTGEVSQACFKISYELTRPLAPKMDTEVRSSFFRFNIRICTIYHRIGIGRTEVISAKSPDATPSCNAMNAPKKIILTFIAL